MLCPSCDERMQVKQTDYDKNDKIRNYRCSDCKVSVRTVEKIMRVGVKKPLDEGYSYYKPSAYKSIQNAQKLVSEDQIQRDSPK